MKRSEPRHRVLRIALTGGIGCGKTEAAHVLRALGAAVWDADESVHRLLRRGTTAYRRIARVFGPDVVRSGGGLCRVALAKAVFTDARQRKRLEKILHPAVIREMRTWLAAQRRKKRTVVAVVPLLFEAGLERGWDVVVCVAADEAIALRRLRWRGVPEADARRRMAAQWSLARKVRHSDQVIWNNGTRRQLAAQVKKFWACCPKEK
ncbi:MAG: dephospho-CoA kinase [Kiritimatiellaeota bacterium]|nr:dephospho-CoA kinase [Kiritimatiellota bacterium]